MRPKATAPLIEMLIDDEPVLAEWVFVVGFQSKVVGWDMANPMRTQLVLDALEMACLQRRRTQVIHHSDQGSQ